MEPVSPVLPELKLVSTVPFPEHLFACFAKIKSEVGVSLKNLYQTGKSLPAKLDNSYNQHLIYTYELGEKGFFWEAGPSADFTEILYIYSTQSLAEAQKLLRADPFFREKIHFDDWWFEWHVHVPTWKIRPAEREMIEGLMRYVNILPTYPPGVQPSTLEIKVDTVTPQRLFVDISRAKAAAIKKLEKDQQAGKPVPAFFIQHAFYRLGPGGTVQMGYDWEAGPSDDQNYDLTVMSVGSLEMAKLLRENDPVSQNGLFYDHRYFEWSILFPFKKVSPNNKAALKRLLINAGVRPAED
jgi:uncharacterized protein YciI